MSFLRNLVFGLVFFGFASLSYIFSRSSTGQPLIWIPSGFSLAIAILFGNEIWLGLLLGSILSGVSLQLPPLLIAGFSIANLVEPLLASHLLSSGLNGIFGKFDKRFFKLRDLILFLAWGPLLCALIGSIISTLALMKTGRMSGNDFWHVGSNLWVARGLSALVITPLILTWRGNYRLRLERRQAIECCVIVGLGSLLVWYVFYKSPQEINSPFAYWFFPFLLWSAIRTSFRITAAVVFGLTVMTVWSSGIGKGVFFGETAAYVQMFLSVMAVTGFSLAITIEEQKRTEQSRLSLIEELKTTLRLREEFLAVASHELKTPVSSLSMQIQIINRLLEQNTIDTLSPETRRKIIETSLTQIKRLTHLVNDLLDVSRITERRLPLNLEEVMISDLVQGVVTRYEEEAARAGCSITLCLTPGIQGLWDPMRLEQVVINLLTNAFKFGHGKPIDVWTTQEDDVAKIYVRDRGIGISLEDQERIFRLFERAVSEKSYGGMGLGLYISQEIVRSMGGQINVKSSTSAGATFCVELPIRKS